MQDQDQSATGVVGPVVGGTAALGGTAAAVAYAGGAIGGAGLFADQDDTLSAMAASSGTGMSEAEAARFLLQATMGASRQDIDLVRSIGISAWMIQQFSMSRGETHWQFLDSLGSKAQVQKGVAAPRLWDSSIWRQLVMAPDQLRQRVGMALLDTMVVSINGLPERYPQYAMAAYMDLLLDHAFGNFRKLLGAIATNSAMSQFLTFLGSRREEAGVVMPDENFARELMQLFTLGLYELNMDGTLRLDAYGQPIETYDETDVSQLARVFTGLTLNGSDANSPVPHRRPLVINPQQNESGPSTFLKRKLTGGGMGAINAALDLIFNHRNVPPFIAKALIQRLVTSNPSPAYVQRVANRFANNGQGVRGDMKAVVSAILTDNEARSSGAIGAPHTGRLRDTTLRITGWARAFAAWSPSGDWPFRDLSDVLQHSPGRSPSVFNFYRPGYSPPNSELQRRGLVAPELQTADEQSVLAWLDWMHFTVYRARGDIKTQYHALMPLADDSAALFDEVNLLLAAGQLSPATRAVIVGALDTIDPATNANRIMRVRSVVLMVMVSPEFMVLQ